MTDIQQTLDRWWSSLPELMPSSWGRMASDLKAVRRRATVVGLAITVAMAGMAYRAYDVAVRQHDYYAGLGKHQQLRAYELEASRGEVVDRNYIALAVNDRVLHVVLNPRAIRANDPEQQILGTLTSMFPELDPAEVRDELTKDKAYRRLKIKVGDEDADKLRALRMPGVSLEQVPTRVYPRTLLASHVLGRVDSEGHGNLGIELAMERWLEGRDATSPAYFASHRGQGRQLLVDGYPDPGVSRGHTVVLTLDSAIQAMAEEEINTLVENWHPVGASIVVLDPKTGEVLAMVNRPTFDPNHPIETIDQTHNLAVQSAYEPGSTMKAITVAAALEQGTIRKDQTFFCEEGRWQYTPQHAIRDTKRSEWLTVTEVLATSSNICTTKIYETLGKQALDRWVRRFHFGERPPIQLPGANPGLLAEWDEWSDIQAANISFGQGMAASPLQVAAAFATLANDGIYNEPTIVSEVLDNEGTQVWHHEPSGERVVRANTARTVLSMLTAVVHTKKGTGKKARIEGYTVAGKTSTAQKANENGPGYYEDQYYASFVGAVPADDPAVVILVSVDNPEGRHYGNDVAAPTFSRLGDRVLTYLGVPREDGSAPRPETITLEASAPEMAEGFIPDLDVEPRLPGERGVTFTMGVPDFTGLTLAQAFDAAENAGLVLHATGTGIAVGQDLPPGPAEGDQPRDVRVVFEPTD